MRFATIVSTALVFGSLVSGVACVGGSKGISAEDKEKVKAYVLDAPPADAKKIDVNFENRVHIVGYKVEPASAAPGTEAKVTFYWRCDQTLDDGWLLFTHVVDDASSQRMNLDWVGPIRENRDGKQLLGPSRWEKGKVYVDVQTFTMPDWGDSMGPSVTLKTGIWKGDGRLHITSGPSDGDNAFASVQVLTGRGAGTASAKPPESPKNNVPHLEVMKLGTADKIVIDGKADEKAWQTASWTGPFVDVGTGGPHRGLPAGGSAKVLWDDQNVYVFFQVKDRTPSGGFTDPKSQEKEKLWTTTGQPKLWTRDTVEIMIDPDGDGDNTDYYELQINPQNKVFHSQFDRYNSPKTDPDGPFGHEDWDLKLKSAVVIHGTLDKSGGDDDGYDVEIAIPWTSFSKAKQLPPKHGDSWRMNFYAMENNGGCGWSPILGQGNFHKASRFGRVVWNVPGGTIADAGAADANAGATDAGAARDSGAKKDASSAPPSAPPAPTGPPKGGVHLHAP